MGTTGSRYEELSKNVHLERFCGKDTIPLNDSFWSNFLSYNMRPPVTRHDQIELDSTLEAACHNLLENNLDTGNFGTLMDVTLLQIGELSGSVQDQNVVSAWQSYNALFATRCILKYLLETVGEEETIQHIEASPSNIETKDSTIGRTEQFIAALFDIVIDVALCEYTYIVHLEAINCLLVLLSVQLFSQTSAEYSNVYRIIMHNEHRTRAPIVVCTLLNNFAQQQHAPPGLLSQEATGSIVFSIAAGLWNVITMGMGNSMKNVQVNSHGVKEDEEKRDVETPLASQSLLLLLVLTNHCTTTNNPYRDSLISFAHMNDSSRSTATRTITPFRLNLDKLYKTICKIPNTDEVILLLYMLLHQNPNVREYIIKRKDIHLLITPILQILYHAPDNTSHHIYMSLIILLILSEDESFNRNIHEIMLKGVTWYTERCISEISLGGLLILVVIRTIQYNMLKMRDKYLHTNCLAALANMSAQFRGLHPYVSQRLLSLFETLAKKHARLESRIHAQSVIPNNSVVDVTRDPANIDLIQDLTVLEEVLRMVLEIINSALTHQLPQNPNLIYSLLYKKEVFQPYRTHSAFQDIIQNISSVINFFSYKLEEIGQSQIGVTQVLAAIQQGSTQWPKDRLRKFPELKFRYVEEDQPEEFFIPYVWSVVVRGALLHWNPKNIKLSLPNNGDQQTTMIVVC